MSHTRTSRRLVASLAVPGVALVAALAIPGVAVADGQTWHDGRCKEGEGVTVIIDWNESPEASGTTELVRCIPLGPDEEYPIEDGTNTVSVLTSAGMNPEVSGGVVTVINGHEAGDDLTWHYVTGEVKGGQGVWNGMDAWNPEAEIDLFVGVRLTSGKQAPISIPGFAPGGDDSEGEGTDEGGTDEGGSDQGGTDQGGTDQGGTDQGGTDQGGTDQGGTDQGGTDQEGTDSAAGEGGTSPEGVGEDSGQTPADSPDESPTAEASNDASSTATPTPQPKDPRQAVTTPPPPAPTPSSPQPPTSAPESTSTASPATKEEATQATSAPEPTPSRVWGREDTARPGPGAQREEEPAPWSGLAAIAGAVVIVGGLGTAFARGLQSSAPPMAEEE